MMTFDSIGSFLVHLGTLEADVQLTADAVIVKACSMVAGEAKAEIGHYQSAWPPLAESTMEDRQRKGFPADEPLLRTGSLRDSIEWNAPLHGIDETYGYVGTDHPIAPMQELGTVHIPPRSFIGGASMRKEHEIHRLADV